MKISPLLKNGSILALTFGLMMSGQIAMGVESESDGDTSAASSPRARAAQAAAANDVSSDDDDGDLNDVLPINMDHLHRLKQFSERMQGKVLTADKLLKYLQKAYVFGQSSAPALVELIREEEAQRLRRQEAELQREAAITAATTIQNAFRGYQKVIVAKQQLATFKAEALAAAEELDHQRLEDARRQAEEHQRLEDARRQAEEHQRLEDERLQAEEHQRLEDEATAARQREIELATARQHEIEERLAREKETKDRLALPYVEKLKLLMEEKFQKALREAQFLKADYDAYSRGQHGKTFSPDDMRAAIRRNFDLKSAIRDKFEIEFDMSTLPADIFRSPGSTNYVFYSLGDLIGHTHKLAQERAVLEHLRLLNLDGPST